MKVKEVLRIVNEFLGIQELETIAAASSLDGVDVTEEGVTKVRDKLKSLYTEDAAFNNPAIRERIKKELYPSIKGELLGNVDTELDGVSKSLFGDQADEVLREAFTKDKIKKFHQLTEKVLKSKLNDSEKQKLVESYANQINDLNKKHADDLTALQGEISKRDNEFKLALIKNKFKELTGTYKWQPAYEVPGIKDVLINNIFDKINQTVTLKMAPTGEIEIFQKDDPTLRKYEGQKLIGIKDLVEPEVQPYITKAPQKGEKRIEKTSHPIVSDTPRGKRSPLAERIESARSEYQTH
jgi:hypothetical protein